ncbi:hypothetical protein VD0004_g9026 [Verticillium dahliae]|uniref:NAD-dependent epimerase/dehydratase domain-containing protein n=1 Tax=Verticillium dahliae TaxID=27337 RepID=A0A444RJ01_VERDA|nr:hypothetical protein VD0004_g9026 [Verticillium dahliae]PNH65714.1 hypothetical protein VD0001_g8400 [Verticillium dahliae]RXG41084.1 hypothetical protein VDGE_07767 [Verticillium dahliae]
MAEDKRVLVTGGPGFIALHVIHKLLEKNYRVRTTVRSLKRSDDVRAAIRSAGVPDVQVNAIEFTEVDLLGEGGWDVACAGVDYVLHVASPFPADEPKDENDLIKPAREGTLRALRAAKEAGTVKRVVVTSSTASIMYGHGPRSKDDPFTEKDWTELENPKSHVGAYPKSKTLAERAAWDWVANEGKGSLELTTVNPTLVYGPSLGKGVNTSLEIPRRLLSGELPAIPNLNLGVVDVRDVADLHVLALESPQAAGQRYIAISDEQIVSMKQMAADLKQGLPAEDSKKVPSLVAPNILLKLASFFDKAIATVVPQLGVEPPLSNAKAREELGWRPRSATEALIASAKSLKANGQL